MEQSDAVASFSALGQQTRLEVFRLLVRAGRGGLPAGQLAERLGIPANTLSSHLGVLHSAGLLKQRREGRSIIYSTDMDALQRLLGWLLQDCCGGRLDECLPHPETKTNPLARSS